MMASMARLIMGKQIPIILCSSYANRLGGFGGDFLDANGVPALNSDAAIAAAQTLLDAAPARHADTTRDRVRQLHTGLPRRPGWA